MVPSTEMLITAFTWAVTTVPSLRIICTRWWLHRSETMASTPPPLLSSLDPCPEDRSLPSIEPVPMEPFPSLDGDEPPCDPPLLDPPLLDPALLDPPLLDPPLELRVVSELVESRPEPSTDPLPDPGPDEPGSDEPAAEDPETTAAPAKEDTDVDDAEVSVT